MSCDSDRKRSDSSDCGLSPNSGIRPFPGLVRSRSRMPVGSTEIGGWPVFPKTKKDRRQGRSPSSRRKGSREGIPGSTQPLAFALGLPLPRGSREVRSLMRVALPVSSRR